MDKSLMPRVVWRIHVISTAAHSYIWQATGMELRRLDRHLCRTRMYLVTGYGTIESFRRAESDGCRAIIRGQ